MPTDPDLTDAPHAELAIPALPEQGYLIPFNDPAVVSAFDKFGELFFTDNGGDYLGDLIPPDELNRAQTPRLHFGFPYQYGDELPSLSFGEGLTSRIIESGQPLLINKGVVFSTEDQAPAAISA